MIHTDGTPTIAMRGTVPGERPAQPKTKARCKQGAVVTTTTPHGKNWFYEDEVLGDPDQFRVVAQRMDGMPNITAVFPPKGIKKDCAHVNVHVGAAKGCGDCKRLSRIVRRAHQLPLRRNDARTAC